ncbi:MAG: acyltransferase [Spirochaetales bacterium]|nr:MAG: acyltransferase [Spirochaetales bacterium]
MDDKDFDDIRPYRDNEIRSVLDRIRRHPWTIRTLRRFFFPRWSKKLAPLLDLYVRLYLKMRLISIHNVDDFHRRFIKKTILHWTRQRTMTSFSYSGVEHVKRDQAVLYITNHRDIVLDSAFLCYTLMDLGLRTPEIAFGDNLMLNDLVSDLIRINKAFIVRRNLSPKEQLKASIQLSKYMQYTLEKGDSIWLAQRGGRAKDGDDRTVPSIFKMVYLSQRQGGMSFPDYMNFCNITPVAISYEFDPCDVMKAKEIHSLKTTGDYLKKEREDVISMLKGFNLPKGGVHYSFCPPVHGTFANDDEMALEVDRRIIANFRLWPANYCAFDLLTGTEKYADKYNAAEKDAFLSRYHDQTPEVKSIIFQIYARPVINKEELRLSDDIR